MANEVKILLTVEGNTVKIQEVSQEISKMGETSANAFTGGNAAAQTFANTLLGKLAIYGSLTVAAYKLEQALVAGFKAGIQAVDEYRLATIGVAATLADLAPQGVSAQQAYSQALVYSKDMYNELELAAARYFATGKEMVQAWNIMAQKGVVLRKDEIDHLGIIVDKVKLLTAGQVSSLQIAQELRSALSGQARATDQLGMLLKDKLGDAWTEVIKKVKETGTLAPLAEQFQGLVAANADVQNTLEAQKATLTTLLSQVGRAGLGGAYEDIVGWLKITNDYLTEHRNEIGGGIYRGWIAVKDLVEGVHGFISDIDKILNKLGGATYLIKLAIGVEGAKWFAGHEAGQNISQGFGALGADYYSQPPPPPPGADGRFSRLADIKKTLDMKRADTGAEKFFMLPNGDIVPMSVVENMPETGPRAGDKSGGGKGAEAEARRLMTLYDTLQKDIARLSEGSFAEVDANLEKTINQIYGRIEQTVVSEAELEVMARQRAALQKEKLEDNFARMVAKESGNAYAALDARYNDDLKRFGNSLAKKEDLAAIWYKGKADLDDKFAKEALGLEKGYLDALAGSSPLLSEQLALKEKSLGIEAEINRAVLEKKLRELEVNHVISAGQADEMRGLAALSEQAKKYALERAKWETQGVAGGVHLFAMELRKESESALALGVVAGLKGAKGLADNAITDLIMSPFTKKKMDFKKIGVDIAASIASGFVKMQTGRLFSFFADGAMGMVNTWTTAQKSMTAASLAGDAARAASTAAGASQSIGILSSLANLTILKQAGQAAAGGFKSVMVAVPFPLNVVLAPVVAAAAFAATMAFGSGGGGGGGGGSLGSGSHGGDWGVAHQGLIIAHQGLIVAHQGWPAVAPDERLILAQTGEGILPRSSMSRLGPGRFEALRRGDFEDAPSGSGGGGGSHQSISVNVNQQVLQSLDRREIRKSARNLVRGTEREMRRLGRS